MRDQSTVAGAEAGPSSELSRPSLVAKEGRSETTCNGDPDHWFELATIRAASPYSQSIRWTQVEQRHDRRAGQRHHSQVFHGSPGVTPSPVLNRSHRTFKRALEDAMDGGNRTKAGFREMPRSAAGAPSALLKSRGGGLPASGPVMHRDIECVIPISTIWAQLLTHDAVEDEDLVQGMPGAGASGSFSWKRWGTDLRAWSSGILHKRKYVQSDQSRCVPGTASAWSEIRSRLTCAPADRALGKSVTWSSADIAARRNKTHGGPDDRFGKGR